MTDKPETAAEVLAKMKMQTAIYDPARWADLIERAIAAQGEAVADMWVSKPSSEGTVGHGMTLRPGVVLPPGQYVLYTAPAPAPARVTEVYVDGFDAEAVAWAYRKLLDFGCYTSEAGAMMGERLNLMLLNPPRAALTAALGGDHG